MEAPSAEFWLNVLVVSLILGSCAVWLPIAVRWHNEGSVLPYEPRRPVPWDVIGAAPALLLVAMAFVSAIISRAGSSEIDLDAVLWGSVGGAVLLLSLVLAAGLVIVFVAGGSLKDLGLPQDAGQLCSDISLGALCWLAALLPVFLIQWVSTAFFGEESQNPVINQVKEHANWQVFVAAIISAVVVAPIFEEFVFRLLLQGWLERAEDDAASKLMSADEPSALSLALPEATSDAPAPTVADSPPIEFEATKGMLPGISHGFVPIAVSSLLFSLAHIGFGPDPVALFVLALFLGYVYQRTHRIVPCIVMHVLFNSLNLLMLWLVLQT
jgi:membrane protease YdiL (CAAX protease family)